MTSTPAAIANGRAWLQRSLGERGDQLKTARRVAIGAAAVVSVCATVLIGDYAVGVWRNAGQTARIVELEGRTGGDPEVAVELHEERKRQTDESLARETRGRALAWILLLAGGALVASSKWSISLRPQSTPSLDDLIAVRFAPPEKKTSKRRDPAPAPAQPQSNEVDLAFVEELVARFGRSREAAIPILQAIQTHYRYLPDEALKHVCEQTEITPAQIAGTSSFYSQFRRSPVGEQVVKVCHGTACHVAGAEQITEELRRHLDIPPGEDTDPQRRFTVDKVACVGCCSLAPVMMIEEETAGRLTPATARQALDEASVAEKA